MSSFHRRLVYMRKNSLKKLPQLAVACELTVD